MDDIRRVGPVTPIGRQGAGIELSVPLNATPTRTWWRIFESPDEWKEPCHPSRITMKHRAMLFTCEEWRIPLWTTEIDRWIALANQRYGQHVQSQVGVTGPGA